MPRASGCPAGVLSTWNAFVRLKPVHVLALMLSLAAGACDTRSAIIEPIELPPAGSLDADSPLLEIRCTARTSLPSLTCGSDPGLTDGISAVIIGGQDLYVTLSSSGLVYDPVEETFSFEATILSLVPQPLGTEDGETPHDEGVRAVFHTVPTVLNGTGVITIANASGTDTFTGTNQPYFEYAGALLGEDGILSQNEETGELTWIFNVPATVDEFEFLVYVVAAVPFPEGYVDITPGADTVRVGDSAEMSAIVRSLAGSAQNGSVVTWSSSDETIATVDAEGRVTSLAPGKVTIIAEAGARRGSATIAVCPVLSVGEVYLPGVHADASFCLGGGEEDEEYTVIPMNLSPTANLPLSVMTTGIAELSGAAPNPLLGPMNAPKFSLSSPMTRDASFEERLRSIERRQLEPLMDHARRARTRQPDGLRRAIVPGLPVIGDSMALNVEISDPCTTTANRIGRVAAIGTHIIILADTANPKDGLTDDDFQAIADTFDQHIYPAVTDAFGEPTDLDENGRVIAFYTSAVNELTSEESSSLVGGFVYARDLFPTATCATSNLGELFYMLAADPNGEVNGNVRTVDFVKARTLGTLAHEFEHLINASRRMYVNAATTFEEVWLDEGLAHVAEELVFYSVTGLTPGANLSIPDIAPQPTQSYFFTYMEPNLGRFRQWLLEPDENGLFDDGDDLATRGAAWTFLRYVADHQSDSGMFLHDVVNSQIGGMSNLQRVLGSDPLAWVRDFNVAIYADDAGLDADPRYEMPSWNFRNLYQGLNYRPAGECTCAYELDTRDQVDGVVDEFTLASGGSAAFLRLGVSARSFAGVALASGGGEPAATMRVAVIRRR